MSAVRTPELPEVLTRAYAASLGVSDYRLASLVRRGELVRLRSGVYARPDCGVPALKAVRHVEEARAALQHHRSGFVASHLSAAAAHGLPLPLGPTGWVHVTAVEATQRSRKPTGVRVHHCDSTETTVVDALGLRITGVARTVVDCLRCWGPRIAVPIADAALHRHLVTPNEIHAELGSQLRWEGVPRARISLELVDGRRESWFESFAFVLFSIWGVPAPEPQVDVLDESGLFLGRVDGAWLSKATVLELDGLQKYALTDVAQDASVRWAAEKRRYDAMGNLGLERVRFTLDDLLHRPRQTATQIQARRSAGSADRFSGQFRLTDATGLRCL